MNQLVTLFLFAFIIPTLPTYAQNKIKFSDIKAGMRNEGIERQALWLANERATNLHWLAEYKKAKIISDKWQVVGSDPEEPICRIIHIELYCEKQDGDCEMSDFTFREKFKDGKYQHKLLFLNAGDFIHVDCE